MAGCTISPVARSIAGCARIVSKVWLDSSLSRALTWALLAATPSCWRKPASCGRSCRPGRPLSSAPAPWKSNEMPLLLLRVAVPGRSYVFVRVGHPHIFPDHPVPDVALDVAPEHVVALRGLRRTI